MHDIEHPIMDVYHMSPIANVVLKLVYMGVISIHIPPLSIKGLFTKKKIDIRILIVIVSPTCWRINGVYKINTQRPKK